jgi:hypothetical protein
MFMSNTKETTTGCRGSTGATPGDHQTGRQTELRLWSLFWSCRADARTESMSDNDDIQRLTEIERITNGKPSYFDMNEAFCDRMRAAIAAGLESAPSGVITTPGTKSPRYIADQTSSYQRQRNEWWSRSYFAGLWHWSELKQDQHLSVHPVEIAGKVVNRKLPSRQFSGRSIPPTAEIIFHPPEGERQHSLAGENWGHLLVSFSAAVILDSMRDIFACLQCNSIYEIDRHRQQPLARPHCRVCAAKFPPSELGEWLSYRRAEPEWSIGEWLGVHATPFSVPSPRQAFAELAQRELQSADPALPSSRLQRPSSFGSSRTFRER